MKNGKFLTMIILLAFSLPFAYGGCSGGGGDGGETLNAPDISNLFYTPKSADLGSGGGSISMFASIDFVDADGNVSTVTINVFDSTGNQIDSNTDPIQGASGITSGTIQGTYNINTSVEDDYTFDVFITDTTNLTSNILTGTFIITNPPWKTKTSMPMARSAMGSVTVDGKIYIVGGAGGDETMVYDPATDTWTFAASIPTDREQLTVSAVNGKIYAIGGYGDLDTVEEYDPITDTWATKSPMPTGRHGLASSVVNDKIYAIGGSPLGAAFNTVEEYDPATDSWTTKTAMPTVRDKLAAAAVNGKIYAIGGRALGDSFSTINEEYDPATDTWTSKAFMPTGRYALAVAVVNGKIYAIGGWTGGGGGDYTDAVEEYDPATDIWTVKTSMPTARTYLSASSENGKIYAFGGSALLAGGRLNTVEEYDPSLD
jgi:N-acetylneuraminic acid mutarotase